MRFNIEYESNGESRELIYSLDDYSFDTEPSVHALNFEIVLNKLNLTVINNKKVVQVWGFCGYKDWIPSNISPPFAQKGTLEVIDTLDAGISHRLGEIDYPIHVNPKTSWVCIGNHMENGLAVEFIKNCIAVITKDGSFISLWLKSNLTLESNKYKVDMDH